FDLDCLPRASANRAAPPLQNSAPYREIFRFQIRQGNFARDHHPFLCAGPKEVLGHLPPDFLKSVIMINRFAITRALQIDSDRRSERRARTCGEWNNAVGQEDSF